MTEPAASSSIIVERMMPHSATKIWRALTETNLLEQWLANNDFQPVKGHKFNFRRPPNPGWNGILDCEVLSVEPFERLVYTWNNSGVDRENGLKSVVAWTLTPLENGTLVRMEQSGFRPEENRARGGARVGWQRMLEGLLALVTTLE
jgi:uncharacterized protein YndB with AHSA1/START domain